MNRYSLIIVGLGCLSLGILLPACVSNPTDPPKGEDVNIRVRLSATREEVLDFLGTAGAKLVFENRGYLYLINYTSKKPKIEKLENTEGGVLPSLSSDGAWLTYAKGVVSDGMGGDGSVWIRGLSPTTEPVLVAEPGFEPRFTQGEQPEIIYVTQGGPNLYLGKGKTVRKKVADGVPETASSDVYAGGGYVGGLSKDGRYLATGYQEGRMLDLQDPSGESKKIHRLASLNMATGFDTIIEPQVCNASISSSGSHPDAMMYIDFGFLGFGYAHQGIGGGDNWGIHDIIFVSDHENRLLRSFRTPALQKGQGSGDIQSYHWDDPEWSNHPYYAVANLEIDRPFKDAEDRWIHLKRREQIYIINIKNRSFLKIVEVTDTGSSDAKTDLKWPWLWVKIPTDFKEAEQWL